MPGARARLQMLLGFRLGASTCTVMRTAATADTSTGTQVSLPGFWCCFLCCETVLLIELHDRAIGEPERGRSSHARVTSSLAAGLDYGATCYR